MPQVLLDPKVKLALQVQLAQPVLLEELVQPVFGVPLDLQVPQDQRDARVQLEILVQLVLKVILDQLVHKEILAQQDALVELGLLVQKDVPAQPV